MFDYKYALRQRLQHLRAMIPSDVRAKHAKAMSAHVLQAPWWQEARVIALYAARNNEVDLSALISDAWHRGCTVALPRVCGEGLMQMHQCDPKSSYELNHWGIKEPLASSPCIGPQSIDLIMMPSIAVDARGYRLGYGGGYYDRFLAKAPQALRCTCVMDCQCVVELSNEEHDIPAHWVVTPSGIWHAGG